MILSVLIWDSTHTNTFAQITPPVEKTSENNYDEKNDAAVMSLLPLEETGAGKVMIDRSEGIPAELADEPQYSFIVRETLYNVLMENGELDSSGIYPGTIMYVSRDNSCL